LRSPLSLLNPDPEQTIRLYMIFLSTHKEPNAERKERGNHLTRTTARCDRPRFFGVAAEPDILVEQLRKDEAIAEADTLLLTVSNQLGVAYNVHAMEAILTHVAPALGWR
jgi:hypothetical protein